MHIRKNPKQIAEIIGLTQQAVTKIISNTTSCNANNNIEEGDKHRELTNKDCISIARLILGGEKQVDIADGEVLKGINFTFYLVSSCLRPFVVLYVMSMS